MTSNSNSTNSTSILRLYHYVIYNNEHTNIIPAEDEEEKKKNFNQTTNSLLSESHILTQFMLRVREQDDAEKKIVRHIHNTLFHIYSNSSISTIMWSGYVDVDSLPLFDIPIILIIDTWM